MIARNLAPSGELKVKVIRQKQTPQIIQWAQREWRKSELTRWKIRNTLRWSYLFGWFAQILARGFTNLTGIPCIISQLEAKLIKGDGTVIDYGIVSYRVVTSAGVNFLVDDWDANGQDISTMIYHGAGTGTNAEASGDTALQTESTTALNPNSTRATGAGSQPSANIYRSVGTLTYDADAAVTEHGLFSASGTGTGTLWDRSVFSPINVVGANGDSVQFTYSVTLTAGS
jgi:hypothetical protein